MKNILVVGRSVSDARNIALLKHELVEVREQDKDTITTKEATYECVAMYTVHQEYFWRGSRFDEVIVSNNLSIKEFEEIKPKLEIVVADRVGKITVE